jgi:uncharacterized protein YndB with AHSA1/START domain
MPECRQQAFINAPLDQVWELAADPHRQTEWWPDTITFECVDGKVEMALIGRRLFRRWVEHALEGLQSAAEAARAPG